MREEDVYSAGLSATRGCSSEGGKWLLLGEFPLRGAARLWEGAAGRGRRMFLRDFLLRGAARLREGAAG